MAAHRSTSGGTLAVLAICAVEEQFDGSGGAVATWVKEVYTRLPDGVAVACPQSSRAFAGPVTVNPAASSRIGAKAVGLVRRLALLAGRNPSPAAIVLSRHGRLWVRALRRDILRAQVVHLQNRPDYAPFVRRQGFSGPLICHMHNDLAVRSPDATTVSMIDVWLFCSDFIRVKAINEFGLDPTRCFTVHNGTTTTDRPVTRELAERRDALFVGRLEQQKGPFEALEIWARAVRSGHGCNLSVIGPTGIGTDSGGTEFAAALRARAEELNRELAPWHIDLVGPLPHAEVLAAMAASRVLLFPCTGIEAFGMVLAESMGQATPVVATGLGGIPEVLSDSSGLLIDPRDLLADGCRKLSDVLTMPTEQYLDMCDAAMTRAHEFTWDEAARRTGDAIDLARATSPRAASS